MPLLANPQVAFPSLISLFTSSFGVIPGLKIAIWLHTFLGLWGMWLLTGYFGIKAPARLLASFIFMFNGTWVMHLAEGHMSWLAVAFLPFMFLAYLKSFEKKQWLFISAAIEGLMFYEGSTYVFAFCLLFICVYGLLRAVETRGWQPVLSVVFMNLLAALLCAPKLFPLLGLLSSNPRVVGTGTSLHWYDYISIFIDRERSLDSFGVWEYGTYIGLTVVVFYLASLSLLKQHTALVLTSLFLLLISFGNFAKFAPWTILHKLPFWSYFQLPTRSLIVFDFTVALLIGLYLGRSNSNKWITFLVSIIAIYICIDLFLTNSRLFAEATKPTIIAVFRLDGKKPPPPTLYSVDQKTTTFWHSVPSTHRPFSQIRVPDLERFVHGAWSDQYLPLLQNKGVVDAYETILFNRNASAINDKDYRGEFYFKGKGKVELLNWSPNKFVLHVNLQKDDRLVVNQNYWPGWHVSKGVLTRNEGLLAVDLPAGEYDISLRYLPTSFLIGVCVFCATVASMIALTRAPTIQRQS